jgi:hypothetical protein
VNRYLHIIGKNLTILLFFSIYIYITLFYFESNIFLFNLSLNLAAMMVLYLFALPVWMASFPSQKKRLIHLITWVSFLIALLWDIQHVFHFYDQININLFFFVVVLTTLFFFNAIWFPSIRCSINKHNHNSNYFYWLQL